MILPVSQTLRFMYSLGSKLQQGGRMILPVSPEIAYWYATRLCEFANLELRRDSWRSLFFSDAQDDAYERFKNAVKRQIQKALPTLRRLRVSHMVGETLARFSSSPNKTFAAVRKLQEDIRASLENVPVAVQEVKKEAKFCPGRPESRVNLHLFQNLAFLWQKYSQFKISVDLLFNERGEGSLGINAPDLRSELYLLLALALGARIRKCDCPCGRFFVARTRAEKIYYSLQCAQRKTAPDRVRNYRERRAAWVKARENLDQLLADMDAIARKQKLQRPRSERQVLEETERSLEKATAAFIAAYPRKKGLGYEEGERFLAQVQEQVKRLQKKVRGY